MNERDLASVGRIACDPGIMKYVLIWLENEEQVAGFVRHAIEEAARRDRQGYILAVPDPGDGDFPGFVLLEIDPTQPTTAEIGCILRPDTGRTGTPRRSSGRCSRSDSDRLASAGLYGKCDGAQCRLGPLPGKGRPRVRGHAPRACLAPGPLALDPVLRDACRGIFPDVT